MTGPRHAAACPYPAAPCGPGCPRALDPATQAMLRADAAQRVAAGQTIDLTAGGPE